MSIKERALARMTLPSSRPRSIPTDGQPIAFLERSGLSRPALLPRSPRIPPIVGPLRLRPTAHRDNRDLGISLLPHEKVRFFKHVRQGAGAFEPAPARRWRSVPLTVGAALPTQRPCSSPTSATKACSPSSMRPPRRRSLSVPMSANWFAVSGTATNTRSSSPFTTTVRGTAVAPRTLSDDGAIMATADAWNSRLCLAREPSPRGCGVRG